MPALSDQSIVTEDFPEEYYRDAEFRKIRASDRQFTDKEFNRCTFTNCDLHGSLFSGCIFENCVFTGCDLSVVKIKQSGFLGVKFIDSKMIGINWTQAKKPIDFRFERCNMNDSVFTGLAFSATTFHDCTLVGCDFAKANLTKSVFGKCDLNKSAFAGSNLTSAKFSDCKIVGGDFVRSE